jgi:hypothetical protein
MFKTTLAERQLSAVIAAAGRMAQTPEYAEQPSRKLIQSARLLCKKSKNPPDAYVIARSAALVDPFVFDEFLVRPPSLCAGKVADTSRSSPTKFRNHSCKEMTIVLSLVSLNV